MIIRKPIASTLKDAWTTALHFEGGAVLDFYMRASVAWTEGEREGFALLAGKSLSDGMIYIFEQFRFLTVDHWLTPAGAIRPRPKDQGGGYHLGFIQAVLDWEALYKCCSFYHGGQHVDVTRRHLMELYRNPLLPHRIEMIEVPYVKEVGDDLIREKLNTRSFAGQTDSPLASAVKQWVELSAAGVGDNNMIQALRILLAGYEYQPHVRLEAA